MIKYNYYFILFLFSFLFGNINFSGQAWLDYNNYINKNIVIGYIPKLTLQYKNIDFEYSSKLIHDYTNSTYSYNSNEKYRYWVRYNNKKIDLRYGLQKISFGSALILRNLNWFDTIDFRNSSGQTVGQRALQIKYFLGDTFVLSSWIIPNIDAERSFGNRIEFSNSLGSYGLTYFKDNNNNLHNILNVYQAIDIENYLIQLSEFSENERYGFDYRYDGYFGFWVETSYIKNKKYFNQIDSIKFATIGLDYTINIWNGVYFMLENMSYKFEAYDSTDLGGDISSLMVQYPIGILYDLSYIKIIDNEYNNSYDLIRLITTYDYFTINYSYSFSKESDENNFQLMFIYNY